MTKWLLIFKQQYSETTAEYGFGDYPQQISYIAAVVEAETLRKAQAAAKKQFPRVKFNGRFAPYLVEATAPIAEFYTKPADIRLTREAVHMHRAALETLNA